MVYYKQTNKQTNKQASKESKIQAGYQYMIHVKLLNKIDKEGEVEGTVTLVTHYIILVVAEVRKQLVSLLTDR